VPLRSLTPYFSYWRTTRASDREVVDAVIHPTHAGPSDELRQRLEAWPGTFYWSDREGARRVVLIRGTRPNPRERWWLHVVLFLVTFATVLAAGATLIGQAVPFALPDTINLSNLAANAKNWVDMGAPGLSFSLALMGILLVHELGHYALARRYAINASPPYFIPAPWWINFIGTFGAFIRLRSPIVDRRQLLDVGAAGPWAGLLLSVGVLAAGLLNSQELTNVSGPTGQFIYLGSTRVFLGDSILMSLARNWLVGGGTVLLHPIALAGWVGLLVTMLNLVPLGQLDGGHIMYALIGRRQALVGRITLVCMLALGYWFWGWFVWAALILLIGRGRVAHPAVLDPYRPIPVSRIPVGILTAVIFILTFTASPFLW
jgi:Peptidase family M50